jgi:hypothetical protein
MDRLSESLLSSRLYRINTHSVVKATGIDVFLLYFSFTSTTCQLPLFGLSQDLPFI